MDSKTDVFKDIVIGTVITSFLYLTVLAGFFPMILFCSAPGIYFGVKRDMRYPLIINVIPAVIGYFLFGYAALVIGVMCLGTGLISANCINRNKMITNRVVNSTAFIFIFMMLIVVAVDKYGQINIVESLDESLISAFNNTMNQVKEANMNDAEQIKNVEQMGLAMINQLKYVFPSFILIGSFFISLVSNMVATSFIRNLTTKIMAPMKLSRFRVSMRFSMAALIIFVISFLFKMMDSNLYGILSMNLMMIFYVILFLQGLGVISHWIEKTSSSRIIKTLVIVASVLSVYMNSLVSLVGAIDLIFNFRKIRDY